MCESDRICRKVARVRANSHDASADGPRAGYRRDHAARAAHPAAKWALPRLGARSCGLRDRRRPPRSSTPRRPAETDGAASRMASARLLPHDNALPPRRSDTRSEPRTRDAVPEWRLRPGLQPSLGSLRAAVGRPLRVEADRGRPLPRRALPLRAREPRSRRPVRGRARMALERRHLPRCTRFARGAGVRPLGMATTVRPGSTAIRSGRDPRSGRTAAPRRLPRAPTRRRSRPRRADPPERPPPGDTHTRSTAPRCTRIRRW
jgi:hypothetical protein